MPKYIRRCYWRWVPRRIHTKIHLGLVRFPWRLTRFIAPPCEITPADVEWLQQVVRERGLDA